ncbi:hypothetical protein AB0M41_25930 [Streptomyces sp. NPDC051896]|uniref:hypothetical protein n=1 Tax=Streptomyces sp. NPDC051896 TaxID=3155416 RepID=UPI0034379F71
MTRWIVPGSDDQIVPIAAVGEKSSKIVEDRRSAGLRPRLTEDLAAPDDAWARPDRVPAVFVALAP